MEFTRDHHGLFVLENPLSQKDYSRCLQAAMSTNLWDRELPDSFSKHPKFTEPAVEIVELLVGLIDASNLRSVFGIFESPRCILIRYDPGQMYSKSMQQHRDIGESSGIFTVAFSFRSPDCCGGHIQVSTRNDGNISDSRDFKVCETKDNSAYAMFGSHVTHAATPVTKGVRYVYVVFYSSLESESAIIRQWMNTDSEFICYECHKVFLNKKKWCKHFLNVSHNK